MSTHARTWMWGLGAGAAAAALDVALIAAVDRSASAWVLLEAGLFWTTAGLVVVASDLGLRPLLHGVVATFLLSLPWYVLESVAAGHPAHLPPLVVQGLIFGLLFGVARGRARSAGVSGAMR